MCGVASAWMVMVPAPGLGEVGDLALGALDHEVHVEVTRGRGRAGPRPTFGPIVIGGTKWPSMTSTWMTVAPASMTVGDLLAQPPEVGGQDRWGDPARHTSTSIDPPQWLHVSVAVLVMRTIVPCSPQFGQTERSSNRCRQ